MKTEKELWGHKFKVVNEGLDEADVYSFVDNITKQHDDFSRKLESLESLVKVLTSQYTDIAITLIEATKQANSIVSHAQEQAAAEIEKISAQSKLLFLHQSDDIMESLQPKVPSISQYPEQQMQTTNMPAHIDLSEPSHKIGNTGDDGSKDILKEARQKIEESVQIVKQQSENLQTKGQKISADQTQQALETINQQFITLLDVLENLPSAPNEEQKSDVQEALSEIASSGYQFSKPVDEALDENSSFDVQGSLIESASSEDQVSEPEDQVSEPVDQSSEEYSSSILPGENVDNVLFDGTVELALPPPVALDRMLQLHRHLKEMPHIDVQNLGGSVDKGITIRILLDSPTALLQTIGELNEVTEVEEELPNTEKRVPSRNGTYGNAIRRIIVSTKA
jgi:F0F1-type ATP synthase membrane subunit b/b'